MASDAYHNGIPHSYEVDHETPTHYVVRCTRCGRLAIKDDRAAAHSAADNHAIRCRPTGVAPVTKLTDDDVEPVEIQPSRVLAPDDDLTGEHVEVTYDSVSKRAGEKRVTGTITTTIPAPGDDPPHYRGLIIRSDNQRRRRITFPEHRVECHQSSGRGWRKIGDLTHIKPTDNVPTDHPTRQRITPDV